MKQLLYIGGAYHLGFAVFHLLFWQLFDWRKDLRAMKPVNRGIMQTLNVQLVYVFLIVAWLSFFSADILLAGGIGSALLVFIALFWLIRAIEQFVLFDMRRGYSQLLFLLFLAGAAIYSFPLWAS